MTGQFSGKPRIAIYGVGYYGSEAARIALMYGWPIVAAFNRAGEKIGKDLGRVLGLDRDLGVIIEDAETADYANCGAQIGIIAQFDRLVQNMTAYERLANAGINIVCHASEAYFPAGADIELAEKIDVLAKRNNITFTGTGIWDFSRIWAGILIAGPTTNFRSLFHRSISDAQVGTERLMRVCGVAMTQDEFEEKMVNTPGPLGGLYKGIPHHVIHALGYKVTYVTERREPILSDNPTYCRILNRELAPGIALGVRIIATVETEEGVTAEAHIELRILPEGEVEHMMWQVNGKPASKLRVDRADSVHTSAACLVNRIPDVLNAPSGIRLLSQMGPMRHKF